MPNPKCKDCEGRGYHDARIKNLGTLDWEWHTVSCDCTNLRTEMRAEDFIIGQIGTLQPKKGETGARRVKVFDVKAAPHGLLLEVGDADKLNPSALVFTEWVAAWRVEFDARP